MKSFFLISFFALCFLAPQFSFAQKEKESNLERKVYIGGGIQVYRLNGNYFAQNNPDDAFMVIGKQNISAFIPQLSAYTGQNYPFKLFNPDMSLGICPNLSLNAGTNGNIVYFLSYEVPVYLTYFTGKLASEYSCANSGYGIGIGGQLSGIRSDFNIPNFIFVSPSAMIEKDIVSFTTIYRIRLSADILPHKYFYNSNVGSLEGPSLQSIAIHFIVN
jgi:hypothetical protein